MIEINLLPGARKQKRSKSSNFDFGAMLDNLSTRFRDPYLIGAVASTVVAILIVGGMFWWQSRRVGELTAREQVAVQDSTRYAAVIAQRQLAEAQRDSVVRQINIIKSIDGTRYTWPHILEEVSRALPPYTWLKSLQVEAGVGDGSSKGRSKMATEADSAANAAGTLSFRIIGQTVDIQALTRFMKQLEASPWIEGVQLVRTDMILVQPANKEATEFTLDMKLQKPDAAIIRRVPLSIAVR
jgi:Tfp pilus assembly protein PilN